ncbi:MAG: polysaccharide biosynthesis tyrosine autokinase [Clostridia bacterium]|nr:polysaccharide biosynthesis tyrosine autokinase [Clostridia bacterium]
MNEQATVPATTHDANEISLALLFSIFVKRFVYLLIAVVVGALGALAATKIFMTPIYSSTAQFRVDNTSTNVSTTGSGYIVGIEYIANNYVEEVKGNVFLAEIVKAYNNSITDENGALTAEAVEKGLSTLTVEKLAKMITVSPKAETNIFTVKVASPNKQEAYLILKVFEENTPAMLTKENSKEFLGVALNNSGSIAKSPDSPNTMMNVLLGAFLLAMLTYAAFFLVAILDNTVYDEDALKNHYTVPVVGTLPQWTSAEEATVQKGIVEDLKEKAQRIIRNPLERRGAAEFVERDYEGRLLSADTPFFITESLKSLRTNLSYMGVKKDGCCVYGIVSAYAGAGKSLMAANIAISFAQLNKRVLVIDADMRCPVQHKIFKNAVPKDKKGLSEVLAGIDGVTLQDCICRNEEYGFDLLCSGHIPPNPSELLASAQMTALMEQVKGTYDYIFVDLPPVLETTDAGVLSGQVDCYVLVVRAGHSRLNAVTEAMETLQATGAHMGGFVLNDVDYKRGFGYGSYKQRRYGRYGGRYGGQYGRYGQAADKQAE